MFKPCSRLDDMFRPNWKWQDHPHKLGTIRHSPSCLFLSTSGGIDRLPSQLSAQSLDDIKERRGGFAGADANSKTKGVNLTQSGRFDDPKWGKFAFNFFDTPGHGAADNHTLVDGNAHNLMESTIRKLMEHTKYVHAAPVSSHFESSLRIPC